MGPPTGFRTGYWASPPAGGLALPERFRRRRNRSAFGDSAEGGIALLLPPCGRLTYKSRCAQCKYELTGMNKLGYANAGGRSAGMREAHSGCFGKLCFPTEASPADRAANAVFPLPVEEKTPPEASTCSKRRRQGVLDLGGLSPFPSACR